MGAWCKHNILWFFLKKNKNWTKCRLNSKKSVLYRDCSHEDSPSLNGNLSFLTQFLLLPLKFSPFLWRHMASAECYCGSPRPHNAVQVRRMPLRIENLSRKVCSGCYSTVASAILERDAATEDRTGSYHQSLLCNGRNGDAGLPPRRLRNTYSCSQVAKAADFDSAIGCSNQPSCAKKISMKGGCRNAQR